MRLNGPAINGEKVIGHKTAENGTKWLPLGGCSCFFLRFCREQKVISRAARHAKARQRYAGDGGKATHFLRERWRAYRRSRCTGDGEVTNYSSLSAAPVFKGRAFHPGNQAASSKAPGIPRPSIHHKPAATMLTTSFRHVVEDLFRPKLRITLSSPPKSLWSIHSVWHPLFHLHFVDDRFPPKKIAFSVFVSSSSLHRKISKRSNS